jgi:protein O-mannosyl-transferase
MANQTGTAPSLTVPFWRPGVIVASGLAAYSNSFGGVFLLDDDLHLANFIVRDPFLGWAHYFTLQTPRPVAMATLAANYAVGGLDPWGYHLVNLVVHLAAALVLYALIGRTLRLPEMPDRYRSRAADLAFAAAAVWVVHPLTTQAVTYVIQRMESLMALWYLIALYALNRGATADRAGGRFGWYAAATISAWLSLGTKEVGMTLPVAALMYDRCYLSGSWGTAVRKRGLVWPRDGCC